MVSMNDFDFFIAPELSTAGDNLLARRVDTFPPPRPVNHLQRRNTEEIIFRRS